MLILCLRAFGKRHLTTDFFRVSLIGEHIDYALFGVFPAAIERDILLACGPSDPRGLPHGAVSVQNLDHRFPPRSFSPVCNHSVGREVVENEVGVEDMGEWHLDIDKTELRWESYVKAGYYVGALIAHPIISVS
jgi:galactokinase